MTPKRCKSIEKYINWKWAPALVSGQRYKVIVEQRIKPAGLGRINNLCVWNCFKLSWLFLPSCGACSLSRKMTNQGREFMKNIIGVGNVIYVGCSDLNLSSLAKWSWRGDFVTFCKNFHGVCRNRYQVIDLQSHSQHIAPRVVTRTCSVRHKAHVFSNGGK